jgi:restriction system protein
VPLICLKRLGNCSLLDVDWDFRGFFADVSQLLSSIARMGKRRGFFAELQHQQRLADQHRRRQHAAAVQAHNWAVREADRAQREYDRAVAAAHRAVAAEQAEAHRASKVAYFDARRAEAERQTAEALDSFEQIDSILAATLEVDDYVDLESLKLTVEHPPFPREDLTTPRPEPKLHQAPPEPQFVPPAPPTGLSKVFSKQKHAQETAQAHAEWTHQHQQWHDFVNRIIPARNADLLEAHAKVERQRANELAAAIAEHKAACAERERNVEQTNASIDQLIAALAANDPQAINEYVGIVLGNSAYPKAFDVEHDYEFDADLGELTVAVNVPPPSAVPNVKAYKHVYNSDEIRETSCTQKEQRERYNNAVAAVAIRTFHEVFESDRAERIKTISLTVQTEDINPATGNLDTFPLVAAAGDREEFLQYDLRNVDPAQTLAFMRASLSKNAFGLKPISTARGIR